LIYEFFKKRRITLSKKFLLSQSATTKVAIGLATIGGIGAVGHHVINQVIDSQAEAKEQSNNKDVTGLNAFSEVLLPKKVSSILDSPIGPVNSNIFESDKKVDLSSLNLENSTRVEDETIPFETEIKYNDDKPSNYVNLIQEGSNGSHTTTFIDSFDENGKLIQSVKTLEENEKPKKQIIEIGTKNIEKTDEVNTPTEIISNRANSNVELESKTIIETIPKETIYTIDENLSKDESYTVKGKDGQKEVTTNTVSVNGVDVHKEVVHEEVVNPAVHDVTYISEEAYNKKVASQDLKEIKVEETTETTTKNTTKEVTENTTAETTTTTTSKTTEVPTTTEATTESITEPNTEKTTESTTENTTQERKVTKERNTTSKILQFQTTVIEDENLPEGQIVVEQLGVNGSEYDVYQDTFVDGNLVSSTIIRTVTTEPVNQIERHGTKKDETKGPGQNEEVRETLHEDKKGIPGAESVQKIVKETTTKDLKIDVVYDETMPEGTEEVLEEGKAETTEITYKITSVNDEVISKEKMNEEITQQAVARVVKRGTGKTTKSYDNTITKIPFETETIQDDTLLPEESYTKQEGLPGSEVTEYELTYMNGNLVSKEVTSTHRIKEPTKEIKVVGTKKVVQNNTSNNYQSGAVKNGNVVDLGKTRDITLKQGLADDDVLPNGITVRYFTITDNTPLEKIVTLSEDERYQKSDKEYYNSMIVSHNGSYIESGIPLSQGGADYINEHLDSNLLAMYMEQHINELRASLGKKPLRYKAELQQGTQQRADEQAKIGSLRSGGRAHTRPDGTEFRTAFTYLNKGGLKDKEQELGENTAQFSSNNPYTLTSEKRIAETLFNYWKNSPGHYANMISDNYKYFSFAASVGRASANMEEYSELYPIIMGVQVFQ
jgi:uncharacterized protein YabE (DUF348 family)/uncharacterized protein YkwD